MAGATYLLLQNPEALRKLTEEIRTAFAREDEIDLTSVNKLTYLFACLDEALRMYPPVAVGLPRVCPLGGAEILGEHVSEGVS
jgi:cytochrome P450